MAQDEADDPGSPLSVGFGNIFKNLGRAPHFPAALFMKKCNLIYIMGRGHSGSTVLDGLLGSGEGLMGIGELISGIGRGDRRCGCGDPLPSCTFWKRVRSRFEQENAMTWAEAAALSREQAHVRNFVSALFRRSAELERLREATQGIVHALQQVADVQGVVDSSKEVTRALFLARFVPQAKIIYLVRNPDRYLASSLHRIRDGTGIRFLRRTYKADIPPAFYMALRSVAWSAGSALAEVVCALAPSRCLRVRYEDLCMKPAYELQRIEDFTGYDLHSVREAVAEEKPLSTGHTLAGNRMRMKRSFVFDPSKSHKRPLPKKYEAIGKMLTWPLRRRYGY